MARASKVAVAVVLLLLLAAAAQQPEHNYVVRAPLPPVPPRAPPRAPPRRRNPFPPQPEPSDADLEVPPTDTRYPLYADLLWIQYVANAERGPPIQTSVDLSEARGGAPRTLTEFERWALGPFVPAGFSLPKEVTSITPRPRFERWSLAKAAYDMAREKGAPESMAKELRRRVGRGLYEQARDFYRRKP